MPFGLQDDRRSDASLDLQVGLGDLCDGHSLNHLRFCYLAEGFNLTPLEAAACGTQIIVTKGGSTDDYFDPCLGHQIESTEKKIKTNSTVLVPKLDSLVHILGNKIINKPDKLKDNRSEYVRKNFSWKKTTEELKKEFESKLN